MNRPSAPVRKGAGRPAGVSGAETARAIRDAGAALIRAHGYAGMNLRDLAGRVNLQAGSLYNHIASKQDLLFLIIRDHMAAALDGLPPALDAAGPDPVNRLRAFIGFHITFHTARPVDAAVCLSELRSLEGENRRVVFAQRRAYEAHLRAILNDGIAAGVFHVADARLAGFAVLGAVTGVLTWYRPGGAQTPEQIAAAYADMLTRGLAG